MSVEGQVLGAATIAGGTAGTASTLANTGSPVVVGAIVGLLTIVVLAFVTRAAQKA
jgi:hypothetical protein